MSLFAARELVVFVIAALTLNLTPGPDMIYVAAHSLGGGRRQAFASVAGITTGRLLHLLAAILGLASTSNSVWQGGVMLAVYSLGLAIPFLLTAIGFTRMTTAFAVVKRHYTQIMAFGGAVLVVMGVLVYTGELFRLNIEAQQWLDGIGLNFFNDV